MKSILYKLVLFLLLTCSSQAYYQAEQGRWISRDPIEEHGGGNIYSFVDNSPVSSIDVLGMIQWYENYGGPSWTNGGSDPNSSTPSNQVGPPFGPPPADDVDDCYRQHDICHKQCDENNPVLPGCLYPSGKPSDDINKKARIQCKRGCDSDNQKCVVKALFGKGPTGNRGGISGLLHGLGSTAAFTFTNRVTPNDGNPSRPRIPGRPF